MISIVATFFLVLVGYFMLFTLITPVSYASETSEITSYQCDINPESGKRNLCTCQPNEQKNKIAILIKNNGIYDKTSIVNKANTYFNSVKTDLNIDNYGIAKFSGNSVTELDSFIEGLYTNNDVAYIILVGEDLPVANVSVEDAADLHSIYLKLEYVGREWSPEDEHNNCKDLGISYILPPFSYTQNEKVLFIEELLERYANYHNNPNFYFNQYRKDFLRIRHDSVRIDMGTSLDVYTTPDYNLPEIAVLNSSHLEVQTRLKEKHLLAKFDVHGATNALGLGLNYNNQPTSEFGAFYITPEDYLSFVSEHGLPNLFIDSGACQAVTIMDNTDDFCCWPQVFLKTGVWAYHLISGGGTGQNTAESYLTTSNKTIGYSLRKVWHHTNFVFGDILAYYPSNLSASTIPGDINGNGRVDVFDFNLVITDFGKNDSVALRSDINGNSRVDVFDFNILISNFGKTN